MADEDIEDDENEEVQNKDREAGENGEGNGREYFSWITLVDNVSELTRERWDDVFMKNVYEFFNLLSYIQYKNKKMKDNIEKWKRSH